MPFGTPSVFLPRAFVFVGDSHTAGNTNPEYTWPVQLQAYALCQPCPFHNTAQNGWVANNVSQDYSPHVVPYLPSITQQPANFWCHVGSNDIANGTSGPAIYANVAATLARAKADGFFVGVTLPWSDPSFNASQLTALASYNASLVSDPSVTPGLVFNAHDLFVPNNTGSLFQPSNNHLSQAGQALYAASVFALLQSSGNFL